MKSSSILELIGRTPIVRIRRINPNPKVAIFAKLEYLNPGGSIKDRAALFMIEAAERSGELTPDKIVVEATSGNTGIGLALVCAVKGYRLLLTMAESASIERRKILRARGAEIRLTPGHLGTDGAIEEAYRLAREHPDTYFITDQYNNPANWQAHYYGTANEVWEQTQGRVTAVISTLGTSGTLMGISRRLKELNPAVRIVGVEPYLGHKIQGLKNMKESYRPEIFEKDRLDVKIHIEDEEAFETARRLAKLEGLMVGMSSGAAMAGACKQVEAMDQGIVVVILPDGGERYLSTSLFTEREKIGLSFFNTLSHHKEVFEPMQEGRVTLFTNGPAVHSPIHVGEARRFVFADLLDRYLTCKGFDVHHVMNIIDLDDKTIQAADAAAMAPMALAERNIAAFEKDLRALNIRPLAHYPRSSAHVEEMIQNVRQLVATGYAYEKLQSLYFDISRYDPYGQLSGIDLDKIRLGATVDLDDYAKDNPRDFTLLKRVKLSELKKGHYTKTQWGNVRPSWPLQCATVAMAHLGQSFDVRVAGRELMFPLHENEIAIAGALNKKPLARFWLHCDRVLADGKKVDDNAGRLRLQDLLESGWSGREIRYWLLSSHYRKPVVYSEERLRFARSTLQRLDACVANLKQYSGGRPYGELDQLLYDLKSRFSAAMDDDLNISAALAAIFKVVKQLNRLTAQKHLSIEQVPLVFEGLGNIDTILGILNYETTPIDTRVQDLLQKREQARKAKQWQLADQIRDQLLKMGVTVRDRKMQKLLEQDRPDKMG
jgi:cysteinyl-tRNA synthetase